MKKFYFVSAFALALLTACGGGTNGPNPGQPGDLLWEQSELDEMSAYCASEGNEPYTYQQWYGFCNCVYSNAATRWTLQDFIQDSNYNKYVDQLDTEGVVDECLQQNDIN